MAEESFWTKAKRTVKGFVVSAAKAAPMTLLYSGAAFGMSAALGHYVGPDMNFLNVTGDATKIATRMLGSMVIGSTISGAVGGFQAYMTPEAPAPEATGLRPRSTGGRARGTEMSMGGLTPPSVPNNARETQRAV